MLLSLIFLMSSCEIEFKQKDCTTYLFTDGLLIKNFWERSCQEGELGAAIHLLAQKHADWLEGDIVNLPSNKLERVAIAQKKETLQDYKIITGVSSRKLHTILEGLVYYTVRENVRYSIFLVEPLDKTDLMNAWVTADGNIFVTTAMLEFCQSNDELSFIIAHEISHVENRLPDKFLARDQKIDQLFGHNPITQFFKYSSRNLFKALNQYDELIADRAALFLMYKAGYDPQKVLDLFNRLERLEADPKAIHLLKLFRQTHPYHHTRFDCLNRYLYESKIPGSTC